MATRGLLMTGILAKGHCTNLGLDCRKQIVTSKIEAHNFNQGERKSRYQLHIWYQEVNRWSKLFVKWMMNILFTEGKPLPEATIKYFRWSLEHKGIISGLRVVTHIFQNNACVPNTWSLSSLFCQITQWTSTRNLVLRVCFAHYYSKINIRSVHIQ